MWIIWRRRIKVRFLSFSFYDYYYFHVDNIINLHILWKGENIYVNKERKYEITNDNSKSNESNDENWENNGRNIFADKWESHSICS